MDNPSWSSSPSTVSKQNAKIRPHVAPNVRPPLGDEKQKVNKSKQRSAFPPNYIHSIDSTHMMMTALECSRANITFAGVHDSFWTHAGDVPVMSRILREKFIELHKAPLLDNLYEELKSTYPEVAGEFLPPPEYGDLDIETVRDSTYFFS